MTDGERQYQEMLNMLIEIKQKVLQLEEILAGGEVPKYLAGYEWSLHRKAVDSGRDNKQSS
jgi:hypothetical protein